MADTGRLIPATLPALLADAAQRWPEREAVISRRGRLTYAALQAQATAIARGLAARGVGRGTKVGLLAPNAPEWLAIAFAVWQRGGVVVPLSTLYRPRELHHALHLADVELLISTRRFLNHDYVEMMRAVAPDCLDALEPLACAALPMLRAIVWLDAPSDDVPFDLSGLTALDEATPGVVSAIPSPHDPAVIFFTSGTMADPKGVVHTHAGLARAAVEDADVLGMTPDDRTWGYLPFFFAGGLVAVGLATLSAGGGVVLQDVFEPGDTLGLLSRERVTVFFAWPHQAEALLAHPAFGTTILALYKGVGANAKWAERIYPPDHHAVGSYGMTETPPICSAWPWDAPLARRQSSHGPPVGSREVRICDPVTGAPLPASQEGEICVRGPTVFVGYYKQDPAEAFDADGFFHTGDLGRLDEHGALHFVGRLKEVIKSAGVNIAAAEIEAVLMSHAAVAAAHAVGVPDALRGENVAAFVVLRRPVAVDDLLVHCRAALATYKVPRHLWVRREDELPQKGSGKIDKPRLRDEATRLVAATTASGLK